MNFKCDRKSQRCYGIIASINETKQCPYRVIVQEDLEDISHFAIPFWTFFVRISITGVISRSKSCIFATFSAPHLFALDGFQLHRTAFGETKFNIPF